VTLNELRRFTFNAGGASATLFWWEQWLPADMLYHDRLEELRSQGKKLGQVAFLQGTGGPIVELITDIWDMVQDLHIDYLLILVNPDHRFRWNHMLFQDAGWEQLPWEFAAGRPVLPMLLDVKSARLTGSRQRRFGGVRQNNNLALAGINSGE